MRAVIDTNLLVSAAISKPGSTPRRLLDEVIAGRLELVLSRELIDEFIDVMSRPKIARYLTIGAALEFLERLLAVASFVRKTGEPRGCKDPDDDAVIETAEVGGADFVITGDRRDLLTESMRASLALNGIEVITARDFLLSSREPATAIDQARRIVAAEVGSGIAHSAWQKKVLIEPLKGLARSFESSKETAQARVASPKASLPHLLLSVNTTPPMGLRVTCLWPKSRRRQHLVEVSKRIYSRPLSSGRV